VTVSFTGGERRFVLTVSAPKGAHGRAAAIGRVVGGALAATHERPAQAVFGDVLAIERLVRRMAFDLHDGPLQTLAVVASGLGALVADLQHDAVDRVDAVERVQIAAERLAEAEAEMRSILAAHATRKVLPQPLDTLLERSVEGARQRFGFAVDLEVAGDPQAVTDSQAVAVHRIVVEALSNAGEHSGAGHVWISVRESGGSVVASVTDDGNGFDVAEAEQRARDRDRLGLLGMAERARLLGGRLDVTSAHGGPTTVSVWLPAWQPPEDG
jgi:signal transduction histidine kinase